MLRHSFHAIVVRLLWVGLFLGGGCLLPGQANYVLRDITPGSTSSLPARFVHVFGTTFFTAASAGFGHALWKTDGSTVGTVQVKDFFPGSGGGVQPRELTNLNGLLVCYADDSIHGAELWASDGTTKGTYMIKDINPGNQGRPVYMDPPTNLTVFKGMLYFSVRDGIHGRELWKTDGTKAGTTLVKDINPGGNMSDSHPSYLTPVGDILFFFGYEPVTGWELWKTDGTTAGTVLVKDVWPGKEPGLMTHNNFQFATGILNGNTLLFAAPNTTNGFEIWKSDGTTAGTVLLKDMNPGPGHSYFSRNFCQAGPYVFYTATDGVNGKELWRTDGTTKGTFMVKDINPGAADSFPGWMIPFGNQVIFPAKDGVRGNELWCSDGTTAGTKLFMEIRPGASSSMAQNLYSYFHMVGQRHAYFTADDGIRGQELWRTDGTVAGTKLVADVWPGYQGSYPEFFTHCGGKLIFRARDSAAGQEPRVIFPDATTQAVGQGFFNGTKSPTLTAEDPVLGKRITISGEATTLVNPIYLLLGLPSPPSQLPNGVKAYIDLNRFFMVMAQIKVPSTAWNTPLKIPASPILTGIPFALQAFQLLPGNPLGFDGSNGLVITPGL